MDPKPKSIDEHQEAFSKAPKHADPFKYGGRTPRKPLMTSAGVEQMLADERAARKPSKDYVRKTEHKTRIAELCKRSVAR